ncbi:hypothetical protein EVAR_53976_1 [Eumeta japonica]|uniref:Secreted protein n=1 Tax=Eumeta variegata TaxID=151549 RepID=A0A4C1XY82_EUMVA|nr:hypothetical protein EVAR_53976_1 [Eumeta japonica]
MLTSRSLPSLTLFIALCSANISAWNTVQKDSSRNVEFRIPFRPATLSGPHLLYLRSYCRRYMCGPTMARRSTVDGSRSSTLSNPSSGVRGMRHFAEVHGLLELPVSTDVPDSLPRFTS